MFLHEPSKLRHVADVLERQPYYQSLTLRLEPEMTEALQLLVDGIHRVSPLMLAVQHVAFEQQPELRKAMCLKLRLDAYCQEYHLLFVRLSETYDHPDGTKRCRGCGHEVLHNEGCGLREEWRTAVNNKEDIVSIVLESWGRE